MRVRQLILLLLVLLMGLLPAGPLHGQGCEDCAELKAGLRHGPVTPASEPSPTAGAPAPAVVRAVLYWANGCEFCHAVLDGVLPRLQREYGAQFELRLIEVATTEDIDRFYAVAAAYGFTRERAGVPFLIIGTRALAGAKQISEELPGLIEAGIAAGGIEWPALPEEGSTAASQEPTATPVPSVAENCGLTVPCEGATPVPEGSSNDESTATAWLVPVLAALVVAGLAYALLRQRGREK